MDTSEIRVLAIDLDGTLLRSNSAVSERSVAAIVRCLNLGLHVVIATGRPFLSVKHRLDQRLHTGLFWICSNGASIYRDSQSIYTDAVDSETAKNCIKQLYSCPSDLVISMELAGSGKLFINKNMDAESDPFEVADLRSIQGNVTKFLVTMPGQHSVPLPPLPDTCRVDIWDGGRTVNITSPTASKVSAMSTLLSRLDLGYDRVMAFGDGVNDIELLERSRIGIAMGNAVPEVKSCADLITLSNEEDGVAVVLDELIEERQE